jgi:nucleoside-diphosphate-sugar epimerase
MNVLITGATGFLGTYVVAEAVRQGHQVRAIVRPTTNVTRLAWHNHPAIEIVRLDLRQRSGIVESLQGMDVVIHLAAAKIGDFYTQFAGTVVATENLLEAMVTTQVHRLIAISTFSVYDYLKLPLNSVLDEQSPIESAPLQRDDYAQTKLIQEGLYRDFEHDHAGQVTILRPGMIYGREDLWHALVGMNVGSALLCVAPGGQMPLTYVENCAEAIVAAVNRDQAIGHTINIVDDEQPSRWQYAKPLSQQPVRQQTIAPRLIPLNWWLVSLFASVMAWINRQWWGGRAKMPGIMIPAKLHARFKPLRYSNRRAKQLLGWTPKYSPQQAIDRSCSDQSLLDVPRVDYALNHS